MSRDRRQVLMVFHEAVLGGASRASLLLVPRLRERGWEIVFWTPVPGAAQRELESLGYRHGGAERLLRYRLGSLREPPGAAARLRSLPKYLRAFRSFEDGVDPVLVHGCSALTFPELIAARRRGRPTVMYVQEIVPGGLQGAVLTRLIHAAADEVVTPSSASSAPLRAAGVGAQIVFNGIDPPPAPGRRSGGDRVVIGTVGTVCHRKGSDLFLAAAEQVAAAVPGAEFRMLGKIPDGRERAWAHELIRRARARGIAHGTTDDIFEELADWDVLVMPSRQDPFPLAALEGMAAGLPLVATRVDGLVEMIDAHSGVLVDRDDVAALAGAITDLALDPARRERLGTAARARASARFSLDAQAEGVHQAYMRALRAREG